MRNSRPGSNRNWIHSVQNSGGREEEGGGRGWFNLNQSQHLNQIDLDIWNRIEPVGLDAVVVAPLSPSIGDRWCRPMISGHSDYALNMIKASYHRHHHLCVWHLRWIPSLSPPPSSSGTWPRPLTGCLMLIQRQLPPLAAVIESDWMIGSMGNRIRWMNQWAPLQIWQLMRFRWIISVIRLWGGGAGCSVAMWDGDEVVWTARGASSFVC